MNRKVFVPTYGGGHVKIIIPIVQELLSMGIDVSILALTSSVVELKKTNLEYKLLSDYKSAFDNLAEIEEVGKLVIEDNYINHPDISRDEISLYLGMSLHDLSLEYKSIPLALQHFEKNGKGDFFPIHSSRKIVEYENPDAILLTCGQRFEKAVAYIANQLDIPVLRVIDQLGETEEILFNENICVLNEYTKNNILKNNDINTGNIYITGQPNLEFSSKCDSEKELNEISKINGFDHTIVFFSQEYDAGRNIILKEMISLAQKNPQNLYVYKLHPNENVDQFTEIDDTRLSNFIFGKNFSTDVLIKHCSLAMTFYSTVGLQVLLMDKPLVVFNLNKELLIPDYVGMGYALNIGEIEETENIINVLLNRKSEESKRLTTARRQFSGRKNSAKNIAEVLDKIMKR